MKVILRDDLVNVGRQGEIKVVADGFARNYLLPRKLAMEATPQNLKTWEKERVKLEKQRAELIGRCQAIAAEIEKLALTITVKVGDAGRLFGSVTNATIAGALKDSGVEVDRHSVLLAEPIKTTGEYTVDIRLHPEVVAQAKVAVVPEKSAQQIADEAAAAAAQEAKPAEAPAAEAPAAEAEAPAPAEEKPAE